MRKLSCRKNCRNVCNSSNQWKPPLTLRFLIISTYQEVKIQEITFIFSHVLTFDRLSCSWTCRLVQFQCPKKWTTCVTYFSFSFVFFLPTLRILPIPSSAFFLPLPSPSASFILIYLSPFCFFHSFPSSFFLFHPLTSSSFLSPHLVSSFFSSFLFSPSPLSSYLFLFYLLFYLYFRKYSEYKFNKIFNFLHTVHTIHTQR